MAVIAALVATPAAADPIAEFYAGKQIRIYIRAAAGGNYDIYSRLLGRHITRFIPGNPTVVPINMPGGGGIVALNYVANVAPKDGTVLTMITQSFPMDQALGLDKNLKVDLRTLNWVGNMSDTSMFFFTSKSSATRTLDDARKRETVVAATGLGSIMTQLAAVYNNTLGTRFKVIYGYPSGPAMSLAMERGEVEGRSTSNPQGLAAPGTAAADILSRYNFLLQTGVRKPAGYERVPLLIDLERTSGERPIFDFISNAVSISRPIVTTAGVPAERVAALRRAFDAATSDPDFLKEAAQQGLEISAMNGAELEKIITGMLETPPAVLDRVRQVIRIRSADAAKAAPAGKSK
jgi:tripartite-type tricarboxylate transporter receptor subunit TctC